MEKPISIIIADDDTVFPFGLKITLLNLNKKYNVKIAKNGQQAIEMLVKENAAIVFMDYNMPVMNGVETTLEIKKKFPGTKIIACTYYQTPEIVFQLFRAGIDGFILKEAKRDLIEAAVKVVIEGGSFFSDEIKKVIESIMSLAVQNKESVEERKKFSERELEIIELVFEKYSNREIADKLFIEVRTVETHLHNVYKIIGAHSHYELKKYAEEHHLFPKYNGK